VLQWHRIKFSKKAVASGAMNSFWIDSFLRVAKRIGKGIDLTTVAVFEADDSDGGKSLYLSPAASVSFVGVALVHGAQPCERPAPQGLSLAYGDEWAAKKLLEG